MQRIQHFLQPRQRGFLELLPLLFHNNYPALPGFISSSTPFGITDFSPSKRALTFAKKLSKSFIFKKRALKAYSIDAIYLMGSAGSVAYSKSSDLDIWLCHRPHLDSDEIEELQKKTLALEQWAASLNLEVHFFLIEADGFRRGEGCPISTESCGTTQHYLLLEEFYRTGIFVAGKIPVWWLVPPHQEQDYSNYVTHLNSKRFVRQTDILDFGGLEFIPPEEFLGASLWHLYKAINNPYKSLLKLFLAEAYANDYPNTVWLSFELKRAIYQGVIDPDQLDPYILMYRKVEEYLKGREEADRLKLARYCFYQKVIELNPGTQSDLTQASLSFLYSTISEWDNIDLDRIRDRKRRGIKEALDEHKTITRELIHSYRLLSQFASRFANVQETESHELNLLGRQLYSVLERKPGKIDLINTDPMVHLFEEELSINEVKFADGEQGWVLNTEEPGSEQTPSPDPIKKSRSLLELLAWITLNGLSYTNIRLETQTIQVSATGLSNIHQALTKFLQQKPTEFDQLEIFAQPPDLIAVALFINIGQDPMSIRKDGFQTATDRGDALSYGSMRTNLIRSVDQIAISSWQEVLISRYLDFTGLLDCFCDSLNRSAQTLEHFNLECFCFGSTRAQAIASRIKDVFDHLLALFASSASGEASPRFILRGGEEFYIFSRIDSAVRYWNVANETQLFNELASPLLQFSPVTFDKEALESSPIPHIYQSNERGTVQVFYSAKGLTAEVYILDERGSLFYQHQEYVGLQFLLEPYSLFLQSVLQHYAFLSDIPVKYYCVQHESSVDIVIEPIQFKTRLDRQWNKIRVSADELTKNQTSYTIYFNDEEFSSMEYGDGIFQQVTNRVFQFRQSGEPYPVYITDLDVPLKLLGIDVISQLQTIHLLEYRQKLQHRLNHRQNINGSAMN